MTMACWLSWQTVQTPVVVLPASIGTRVRREPQGCPCLAGRLQEIPAAGGRVLPQGRWATNLAAAPQRLARWRK